MATTDLCLGIKTKLPEKITVQINSGVARHPNCQARGPFGFQGIEIETTAFQSSRAKGNDVEGYPRGAREYPMIISYNALLDHITQQQWVGRNKYLDKGIDLGDQTQP